MERGDDGVGRGKGGGEEGNEEVQKKEEGEN